MENNAPVLTLESSLVAAVAITPSLASLRSKYTLVKKLRFFNSSGECERENASRIGIVRNLSLGRADNN